MDNQESILLEEMKEKYQTYVSLPTSHNTRRCSAVELTGSVRYDGIGHISAASV